MSIDPLSPDYPFYTPYQFAANTPISAIDLDGAEALIAIHSKWYQDEILKAVNEGNILRAQYLAINSLVDPAKNEWAKKSYNGNETAGTLNTVMAAEGGLDVYGYAEDGSPMLLYQFPVKNEEPEPVEESSVFKVFFGILTYGATTEGNDNTQAEHTTTMDAFMFELLELLIKSKKLEIPETKDATDKEIKDRLAKIKKLLEEDGVKVPDLDPSKTYPSVEEYKEPEHSGNAGGNYIDPDSTLYEYRTYDKDGKQVSKDTIDTKDEKMH